MTDYIMENIANEEVPDQKPLNQINKVSLVKLPSLDNKELSPLSPDTLTRLVDEQTKSHEAIEALQQRIQSDTPNSFSTSVRKQLEQSAIKQRGILDQVLSTPSSVPRNTSSSDVAHHEPGLSMVTVSGDVTNLTPLAKRLFPNGRDVDDDMADAGEHRHATDFSEKKSSHKIKHFNSKRPRPDVDNDTGVESDSSSDMGEETISRTYSDNREANLSTRVFPTVQRTTGLRNTDDNEDDDPLMLCLEAIELKTLEMEGLLERAKLDTVLKIKKEMEAEFDGASLEQIPSKCHQKIDRAIQRYLQRELEGIRSELAGNTEGSTAEQGWLKLTNAQAELEEENSALNEKVQSLETSISRVDMLYIMQKKENDYLTEKVAGLEREMANEKLKYESDLDDVKQGFEEVNQNQRESFNASCLGGSSANSQTIVSLYQKLEQAEKRNSALGTACEADQTTIRCLELKVSEMDEQLQNSKNEVNDLLSEIHELREKDEQRNKKLKRFEAQLKDVTDERRVLRETLIMSEHEITLLENKLGKENNMAWNDNKKEILEDLRKLERHIKVIHKEKRKLENKYLAFKIENENLTDSLHSFSRTKDILTPLGSRDVSRRESSMSSHASSTSSSMAGSDIEDEGDRHVYGSKTKPRQFGQENRRRKRVQDHKDKQFAEAVAKKLLYAQKTMSDNNCNFSAFENSGEDLVNEAEELVKRVDSLTAEKRAIKMELESIRSTENVKC